MLVNGRSIESLTSNNNNNISSNTNNNTSKNEEVNENLPPILLQSEKTRLPSGNDYISGELISNDNSLYNNLLQMPIHLLAELLSYRDYNQILDLSKQDPYFEQALHYILASDNLCQDLYYSNFGVIYPFVNISSNMSNNFATSSSSSSSIPVSVELINRKIQERLIIFNEATKIFKVLIYAKAILKLYYRLNSEFDNYHSNVTDIPDINNINDIINILVYRFNSNIGSYTNDNSRMEHELNNKPETKEEFSNFSQFLNTYPYSRNEISPTLVRATNDNVEQSKNNFINIYRDLYFTLMNPNVFYDIQRYFGHPDINGYVMLSNALDVNQHSYRNFILGFNPNTVKHIVVNSNNNYYYVDINKIPDISISGTDPDFQSYSFTAQTYIDNQILINLNLFKKINKIFHIVKIARSFEYSRIREKESTTPSVSFLINMPIYKIDPRDVENEKLFYSQNLMQTLNITELDIITASNLLPQMFYINLSNKNYLNPRKLYYEAYIPLFDINNHIYVNQTNEGLGTICLFVKDSPYKSEDNIISLFEDIYHDTEDDEDDGLPPLMPPSL